MPLQQLKTKIETIYAGLSALVADGKITEADKTALGAAIIAAFLTREFIES